MTKITSIDALVDRITSLYPKRVRLIKEVRELMEAGSVDFVYDTLANSGFRRSYEDASFTAQEIVDASHEDGTPDIDKCAALIARAKASLEQQALEPMRQQLADDFRETYPGARLLEF